MQEVYLMSTNLFEIDSNWNHIFLPLQIYLGYKAMLLLPICKWDILKYMGLPPSFPKVVNLLVTTLPCRAASVFQANTLDCGTHHHIQATRDQLVWDYLVAIPTGLFPRRQYPIRAMTTPTSHQASSSQMRVFLVHVTTPCHKNFQPMKPNLVTTSLLTLLTAAAEPV